VHYKIIETDQSISLLLSLENVTVNRYSLWY
jgi:hypothetical protein